MSNWEDFERMSEYFVQLVKSDSQIARLRMYAPPSMVETYVEIERKKFRDSLLEVRRPTTHVKIVRFARKIQMTDESQAFGLAGEWERLLADLREQISARLEDYVWKNKPDLTLTSKLSQDFMKEARKSPWLRD